MALLRIAPEANKQGRSSYSSLALSNVLLITLSAMICVLLATDSVQAATNIPQQPALFKDKWAEVGNPLLLWTFRQQQCIGGTIEEDMGVGPDFVRQTDAACPEASSGGKTFENSVVGATSTSDTSSNTINSGAIGTSLSALTTPINTAPYQALSLALWFTPTATVSTASGRINVLLELAGAGTGADDLSSSGYQLRLAYASGSTPGANRIRLDVLIDDIDGAGETPILSLTCLNSAPVQALANAVGTRYFLGISFYYDTGLIRFRTYLRAAGGAAVSCGGSSSSSKPNAFVFPSASVFRLGSSSSIISNIFGYRATYHLAALFNKDLPIADFDKLFDAGLPNSLPVVDSAGKVPLVADEGSSSELFLYNIPRYDADDGDDYVEAIKVISLPTKGQLRKNGQALAVGDTVLNSDTFTLVPVSADDFSMDDPSCNKFDTDLNAFTYGSFVVQISDGKGDGSAECNTSPLDPSCHLDKNVTVHVCVQETNDDPVAVPPSGPFVVPVGKDTAQAFSVTCRDIDANVGSFGLRTIRITGTPSLGTIHVTPAGDGACTGGADYDSATASTGEVSVNPGSNVSATVEFCYKASSSAATTALIGTDTISYECEDAAGEKTAGSVTVQVYNPYLAGCSQVATTQAPCAATLLEDTPANIELRGADLVSGHTNADRRYKLNSVPSGGKLYLVGGQDALAAGSVLVADSSTGNLELRFVPDADYFNAMCELNKNPTSTTCASPVFRDALNNAITPALGPTVFSFSLGYDEDGSGTNAPVFGPAVDFRVTVLGVNDPPSSFTGPTNLTITQASSAAVTLASLTSIPINYTDPDMATMRVAFWIRADNARAAVSFPGLVAADVGLNTRFTWIRGLDCISEAAAGCDFVGKGYVADIMKMLEKAAVKPIEAGGGSSIKISIWDPAPAADNFTPLTFDLEAAATASIEIGVTLPAGGGGSAAGVAGISAWVVAVVAAVAAMQAL